MLALRKAVADQPGMCDVGKRGPRPGSRRGPLGAPVGIALMRRPVGSLPLGSVWRCCAWRGRRPRRQRGSPRRNRAPRPRQPAARSLRHTSAYRVLQRRKMTEEWGFLQGFALFFFQPLGNRLCRNHFEFGFCYFPAVRMDLCWGCAI